MEQNDTVTIIYETISRAEVARLRAVKKAAKAVDWEWVLDVIRMSHPNNATYKRIVALKAAVEGKWVS